MMRTIRSRRESFRVSCSKLVSMIRAFPFSHVRFSSPTRIQQSSGTSTPEGVCCRSTMMEIGMYMRQGSNGYHFLYRLIETRGGHLTDVWYPFVMIESSFFCPRGLFAPQNSRAGFSFWGLQFQKRKPLQAFPFRKALAVIQTCECSLGG